MKKTFALSAVFLLFIGASCKKSGKCDCGFISVPYDNLDKNEYDQAKADCEATNCTWFEQ